MNEHWETQMISVSDAVRRLLAGVVGLLFASILIALPARAAEPIKILALDVISGPFKDIGDRYQAGVKYAVDEINASGGIDGRKIQLFVDDSQLKPDVAQRRALKYILDDGVKIIIGGTGSNVVKALAQVADKQKIVLVLYSGEDDAITGADFVPSVFRLSLNTTMHATATVAALADKPYQKFYFLHQDYSFGRSIAESYKRALDRFKPGWKLAGEDYHPIATKDFAPYIQKILASDADMVLSGNWGSDLTVLHKQAADFRVKQPFGHVFLSDPVAMREIGQAAIGSITSEIYMLGVDTPRNRAFIEGWHQKNKGTDHPWPAFAIGKGYNTTMFLAEALKKAKSEDYAKLVPAWEGLEFDGLMGKQVMRACDHQIQSPVAVAEMTPGPGKFYPFPFTGPVTLIPLEQVAVAPKATGNKRCAAQ